jgi:hypothetical protein
MTNALICGSGALAAIACTAPPSAIGPGAGLPQFTFSTQAVEQRLYARRVLAAIACTAPSPAIGPGAGLPQ